MSGLPDGVANGPNQTNHSGDEVQIWERPWTLDEIRQTSANWSLAADSGLFLFLQDFSQRMLSKTHEIERQLDGLIRDTKATDCCLHSVFNDFLMLSNTQFIENRVYDEEVEEPTPKAEALEKHPEQEKTREQKEAELIPKMQEAVSFGLRVLDSAFEQLDIKAGNSDSEDEEASDRVEAILEPKDLYVDRPLPYLIGSKAFMEQDDVGLGDLSSDEISIDSDRYSVIESEDGNEVVHSDGDFEQEEEEGHGSIKKKSSMLSYEENEEEDEDSDIFGESDKEDDDEDDDRRNSGPSSFADELAARIKGETAVKQEGDRTSLSSKKKSKGKKETKSSKPPAVEDESDDLFKPPKMEDDDFSPFGGKGGLFSGGKGLFDDDDEGDLFADAPKPSVAEEETKTTSSTTEPAKPGKKIPSGAVSIFPGNSLFGSGNDSDSLESRENGTTVKPKAQAAAKKGGGGLFDDDDEEDDFFSGKTLKTSSSAEQQKAKPKKTLDLFGGDDEDDDDGDIFNEGSSATPPTQSKKEAVEEQQPKPPEKKMPAGAISMFGPGTKGLLTETLRKRQPSTSEESEKSEEIGPPPEAVKAPAKQTQKPQTRGLFSDDEDSQIFTPTPKSQSKPKPTSQGKGKAPLSIFDDEEEEDLFASAAKSKQKPNQPKASTPQPKKTVTSSLFSDDEDQWLSTKPSSGTSGAKTGGMKSSVSAPSSLPSAKMPQKDSLFDDDDDDLFTTTKESSQNKSQRVALLFEDEGDDDEDKGSLFGVKPASSTIAAAPAAKAPDEATPAPSLFDSDLPEGAAAPKATAEHKPPEKPVVEENLKEAPSSPPEGSDAKKKPVGGVSLFGGINVLPSKQTKSPLDDKAVGSEDFLSKESPPPLVAKDDGKGEEEKKKKVNKNTLSLFDDEEEEEDSDWTAPSSIPTKPAAKHAPKPAEEQQRTRSTGVFLDEELLFSQTQQRDNDPDVDLFASSGKAESAKPTLVKPAAPTLFNDDDEDDLFSSVKPKAPPPKVAEKPSKPKDEATPKPAGEAPPADSEKPAASPTKSKDPSSRIGKLQANLAINPAALLPGAAPRIPGAVSVLPGFPPGLSAGVSSPEPALSPATTPVGPLSAIDEGVSFDSPIKVNTLHSANKGRAKGSAQRRPQTRAARHLSAQTSPEEKAEGLASSSSLPSPALAVPDQPVQTQDGSALPNSASDSGLPSSSSSQPPRAEASPRPSVLTLPVTTNPVSKDTTKEVSGPPVLPPLDQDDLFASDSLFGSTSTPSSTPTTKASQEAASVRAASKTEKEKAVAPSLFDDQEDDLFQKVKTKPASKKAKVSSFMEEDDDEEDIFGIGNSSTHTPTGSKKTKTGSNLSKQDIFQDEVATVPKANKKHKEKSLDVSLFDDNVDIFADLTTTTKPKEKSNKKAGSKSIFADDMDDIFSSTSVKPVTKAPHKSKKTPPSQDTSASGDSGSIFDDPLNALGGN